MKNKSEETLNEYIASKLTEFEEKLSQLMILRGFENKFKLDDKNCSIFWETLPTMIESRDRQVAELLNEFSHNQSKTKYTITQKYQYIKELENW